MQELFGRAGPLAELAEAAERARAGRGSAVLVLGEPGIGKTALLAAVGSRCAGGGFAVVWGGGRQSEQLVPYRPWRTVLRAVLRLPGGGELPPGVAELAGLSGRGRGTAMAAGAAAQAAARAVLHDDVVEGLAGAAQVQPLVLLLDDLHWWDPDSLLLLDTVVAGLRLHRVLLVAASRTAARSRTAGRLQSDLVIPLTGLDVADVGRLVAATAPAAELDLHELLHRTGGNPLFVRELAVDVAAGRAATLPASLTSSLSDRVSQLPAGAGTVLAAAAVAGEDPTLGLIRAVVEHAFPGSREPAAVDEAVQAATRLGLLVPAPSGVLRYRFGHALLREAVIAELDVICRRRLHQAAATALAEAGGSPAELAQHLTAAAADSPSAAQAVQALRRAATDAESALAWQQAADCYRQALDLAGLADLPTRERVELQLGLARALDGSGDAGRARSAYLTAFQQAQSWQAPDLVALAALGLSGGLGGFEVPMFDPERVTVLRTALAADPPEGLTAHLLARLSVAATFLHPDEMRTRLADQAVALARACGDPLALVNALGAQCDALAGPEHVRTRQQLAQDMLTAADDADSLEHLLLALRFRFVAELEAGQVTAATATLSHFTRAATRLGQPRHLFYSDLWTATLALLHGDLPTARAANGQATRVGERADSPNAFALTTSQRVVIDLYAGGRAEAERVREFLAPFVAEHPELPGPRVGLAWACAGSGRVESARAALERMAATGFGEFPTDAEWLPSLALLGHVSATVGCEPAARALLPLLRPYLHLFVVDGIGSACTGSVAGCAAPLAALLGQHEEAGSCWEQALAAEAAAGATLPLARTRLAYGRWLTTRGDQARGQDLLARGEAAHSEMGLSTPGPPQRTDHLVTGPASPATAVHLRHEGPIWTLERPGCTTRLRDARGLHLLAVLLRRPGEEISAVELDGRPTPLHGGGDLGPLLDAEAKSAYRRRLATLATDIEDAEADADLGRAGRLAAERDALISQLASAVGLHGRDRIAGSPSERARVAVTKALRAALARVAAADPTLGAHLTTSLRTGLWCSYQPDPSSLLHWTVQTTST